jgi:hypothetical protein
MTYETDELQTQLKIPKDCKLLGMTNKEIKEKFNVTIFHRHSIHPCKDIVYGGDSPDYKLIPDEFVAFSGTADDILKFTDILLEDVIKKLPFVYGWDNGELAMEKTPLTSEETELLNQITEVAFREMGERTRGGSGDDQWYVDSMYEHLKKDINSNMLVKIVFLLCKQSIGKDKVGNK